MRLWKWVDEFICTVWWCLISLTTSAPLFSRLLANWWILCCRINGEKTINSFRNPLSSGRSAKMLTHPCITIFITIAVQTSDFKCVLVDFELVCVWGGFLQWECVSGCWRWGASESESAGRWLLCCRVSAVSTRTARTHPLRRPLQQQHALSLWPDPEGVQIQKGNTRLALKMYCYLKS